MFIFVFLVFAPLPIWCLVSVAIAIYKDPAVVTRFFKAVGKVLRWMVIWSFRIGVVLGCAWCVLFVIAASTRMYGGMEWNLVETLVETDSLTESVAEALLGIVAMLFCLFMLGSFIAPKK
jgi:hypothetical protein